MTSALDSVIHGDNMDALGKLPGDSVDLCYVDPPFNSGRNHSSGADDQYTFKDTWKNITEYSLFMEKRIKEIHRVLKPNGSFYLHCDISGVFHLKVICDEIFGASGFINDIVWKRHSSSKNTIRNYASIADHILFYAKGPDYTFNVQYLPIDDAVFNIVEPGTGRRFRSQPLVVKGNQEGKVFRFGDRSYTIKKGKALKWTQETIDERLARNPNLIYWTGGGEPRYKTYLDDRKGIALSSIWTDINLVTSTSSERIGYPTQKPVKLLERIVCASSNEGDVVLDAFCGSGTTLVAAASLKRRYIGIDISKDACDLSIKRVNVVTRKMAVTERTAGDL